jgi:hypothetical protein
MELNDVHNLWKMRNLHDSIFSRAVAAVEMDPKLSMQLL